MSKAGSRLIKSAKEALAIARGELKPARMFVPPELDVRGIRGKTGLSQDQFARMYGFGVNQIRDWEQGRTRPTGSARAYLLVIDTDPDAIRKLIEQAVSSRRHAA